MSQGTEQLFMSSANQHIQSEPTKFEIATINEQSLRGLIHIVRNEQVVMDSDLAKIYGYTTKAFNQQVKNNIDKFDEDFMFQLTDEEAQEWQITTQLMLQQKNNLSVGLRSNFLTSNKKGGRRYNPYVFTEQGIYMLMTILRGDLAIRQSKALIRLFKQMKDYIVTNKDYLQEREYIQLSLQTQTNTHNIALVRKSINEINNKVATLASNMSDVVTQSQLSEILLDFQRPAAREGWLILSGQPVEADIAYRQIYSNAKYSIIIIDNYIGLKTLVLFKDIDKKVDVTIISDNVNHLLHKSELDDFTHQYPEITIKFICANRTFHDRYIILDYNTDHETIYHCGASSKDGGSKVTTITKISETAVYHEIIDNTLSNDTLEE